MKNYLFINKYEIKSRKVVEHILTIVLDEAVRKKLKEAFII